MRKQLNKIAPAVKNGEQTLVLCPKDSSGKEKALVWTILSKDGKSDYLFVVNTDLKEAISELSFSPFKKAPKNGQNIKFRPEFSTENVQKIEQIIDFNGKTLDITQLAPGEGRIYKIINN